MAPLSAGLVVTGWTQVWAVAYNGAGTKLATVSEDKSLNIFQVS